MTSANEFIDQDGDGFADDDLLSPNDIAVDMRSMKESSSNAKSFLERDNFENELGSTSLDDPFGEDFTDISKHEIVDVFGEGDLAGRPVIVIYAYRFPSNKTFDHLKFLRYVQCTLDKVVELDYSIIYFHYGLRRNNKPPMNFLFKAYQIASNKIYSFCMEAVSTVHLHEVPGKMHYVNSLKELTAISHLDHLNLPQPIIEYDQSICSSSKQAQTSAQTPSPPRPTQQFNVSLQFVLNHHPSTHLEFDFACKYKKICYFFKIVTYLQFYGLDVEGIFRRSASVSVIKSLQQKIDLGEKIDFFGDPIFAGDVQKAVIHASVLLKTFLRSLGEPIITNRLYPELALLNGVSKEGRPDAVRKLVHKMPPENYLLLRTVIKFLTEVAANSQVNLMDANNLSVVFGPNLTWPTDQQVPILQLNNLNNFCYTLIKHFEDIFNVR